MTKYDINEGSGYKPYLSLSKFGDTTSIEEWLVEARSSAEFVSENKRAHFIKRHLFGDALLEIVSHRLDVQEDVEKIFKVLEEVFGVVETERELMKRMLKLRQQTEESILAFSHRIMSVRRTLISFKKTEEVNMLFRESLIDGVHPKLQWDLKFRVQSNPKVTFMELRKIASECEKIIGNGNMETTRTTTNGSTGKDELGRIKEGKYMPQRRVREDQDRKRSVTIL